MGQPLQYNLSICPPLLHGQSTYTVHQVRVSISLRAIRHPLLIRAPISEPSTSASWVDKGDNRQRMAKVEGPYRTPVLIPSFLPTPWPRGRGSLFLSGGSLTNLTTWCRGSSGLGAAPPLTSQADTGMQGSQCYLPRMRITFLMLKGQSGLKHGNRSKRQALKSASTDLGMTDVGE